MTLNTFAFLSWFIAMVIYFYFITKKYLFNHF